MSFDTSFLISTGRVSSLYQLVMLCTDYLLDKSIILPMVKHICKNSHLMDIIWQKTFLVFAGGQ